MQLVQLSKSLRPLTLAVSLLSVPNSSAYSDLDAFSGIMSVTSNNRTSEYIQFVDRSDTDFFLHKFRFEIHLANWKNKTMFLSSAKSIIDDTDFQSIVNLGLIAVPHILEEIDKNPSTLVWALNLIYKRKITINPKATISDACKLWVKELKK